MWWLIIGFVPSKLVSSRRLLLRPTWSRGRLADIGGGHGFRSFRGGIRGGHGCRLPSPPRKLHLRVHSGPASEERRQDMTTIDTKTIDQGRLEAFVGQAVVDMGAAISGAAAAY